MSKSIKRRRLVARRGAVIVEFALVVPFLALIVFGVIDFSRAYGQMNALDSASAKGHGTVRNGRITRSEITGPPSRIRSRATRRRTGSTGWI